MEHFIQASEELLQDYPTYINSKVYEIWKHERIHQFIYKFFGFNSYIDYIIIEMKYSILWTGHTTIICNNQKKWKIFIHVFIGDFCHCLWDLLSDFSIRFRQLFKLTKDKIENRILNLLKDQVLGILQSVIYPIEVLNEFRIIIPEKEYHNEAQKRYYLTLEKLKKSKNWEKISWRKEK